VFHPLTLELWPFDGCKWSRFAETGIFAQATHTLRAVTAASASTVVRIAKGDRSRAIRLDGATGAPRVHVSGPGGVNLDSPTATGLTRQPQARIMRSEPLRATVVGLVGPVPGQYTITPDAGSATVTQVTEAQDQPDAKVTATVKGRGDKRALVYDIARRPD
jgi:hypothetical protein